MHVIKMGRATMSNFGLFIAAALTLAPVAAISKTPAHDGYWQFQLTAAEIAQMPNAADKVCLAKADQEPFSVMQCTLPQFERIEKRLSLSYRAAKARLNKTKSMRLHSEQSLWLITRESACKSRVGDEINETSETYSAAIIQCALSDLYRRTLWVERYR